MERIEVHNHQIDRIDPGFKQLCHVLGVVAVREDASVDAWMKRFHATREHLGEARDVGDRRGDDAVLG